MTYHSKPTDFPEFGDFEWKMVTFGHDRRSCSYCGLTFDTIDDWIAHMETNMGQDELKCNECQPEQHFKTDEAFKIHMSTFHHQKQKRFLCAFCPESDPFNNVKELNKHINDDHNGNFNKCNECNFETWAHSVLRRHINVKHRKIKSFECKVCPFTSMTKNALNSHLSKEHGTLEDDECLEPSAKVNNSTFKCCFCDFHTQSKKAFHDHFDDSHDGNRTKCLECDFIAPVMNEYNTFVTKYQSICLNVLPFFY